jgi:hypothetical protein
MDFRCRIIFWLLWGYGGLLAAMTGRNIEQIWHAARA